MGKIGATMPSFCLNRIRPLVRVRPPPPCIQSKNQTNSGKIIDEEEEEEKGNNCGRKIEEEKENFSKQEVVVNIGRKIMIVVDYGAESKNALQWALTHTVQSQDMVILLYASKKSSSNPPPPPPAGCI